MLTNCKSEGKTRLVQLAKSSNIYIIKNIKNYLTKYVQIWDQFVDDSIYLDSVFMI